MANTPSFSQGGGEGPESWKAQCKALMIISPNTSSVLFPHWYGKGFDNHKLLDKEIQDCDSLLISLKALLLSYVQRGQVWE